LIDIYEIIGGMDMSYTIRSVSGTMSNWDTRKVIDLMVNEVERRFEEKGIENVVVDYKSIHDGLLIEDDTIGYRLKSLEDCDMVIMDISQVDSSIYFTLGLLIGKLLNSGMGKTKIYLLSDDEGFDPSSHEILTVYILLKGLVKVVPFQVVGDKVEITESNWLDLL
jgi:hypothetical protein